MQLDCFPSLTVIHTDPKVPGRVYIPLVNWSGNFILRSQQDPHGHNHLGLYCIWNKLPPYKRIWDDR
jgi:K+ potassium transporter